jgi:hypothetical protein
LKAEIEALAFDFAPKNKPTVIETGCGDLKPTFMAVEERYQGFLRRLEHKPSIL